LKKLKKIQDGRKNLMVDSLKMELKQTYFKNELFLKTNKTMSINFFQNVKTEFKKKSYTLFSQEFAKIAYKTRSFMIFT